MNKDSKSHEIKFHSIYFRYWLLLLALINMVIYLIAGDKMIHWSGVPLIRANVLVMCINVLCILLFIICSFAYAKMSIGPDGINLYKIDLLIPWDEIIGISHIWLFDRKTTRTNSFTLNLERTIVIYRKDYKPIAIHNISVFALIIIKCYSPQIKTNLPSALFSQIFSLILNMFLFVFVYIMRFDVSVEVVLIWSVLLLIKESLVPLFLIIKDNTSYGHHSWLKTSDPSVIHI